MIGENVPLDRHERAADTVQDLHLRLAALERTVAELAREVEALKAAP